MSPYIKQEDRDRLSEVTLAMSNVSIRTPGELNYLISSLFKNYYILHGPSYQAINDCVGAATCAAAEFYRRIAVDYENDKIQGNGDIYD